MAFATLFDAFSPAFVDDEDSVFIEEVDALSKASSSLSPSICASRLRNERSEDVGLPVSFMRIFTQFVSV